MRPPNQSKVKKGLCRVLQHVDVERQKTEELNVWINFASLKRNFTAVILHYEMREI